MQASRVKPEELVVESLNQDNRFVIMVNAGSKGSSILIFHK